MYAADNSPEYQEFWYQMEKAKSYYRPSQTMNFYVDPSDGHDDYLMSLALLVEAGRQYEPREAKGKCTSIKSRIYGARHLLVSCRPDLEWQAPASPHSIRALMRPRQSGFLQAARKAEKRMIL